MGLKRRLRKVTKLPDRKSGYHKDGCSAKRCRGKIEFIASYPQGMVEADRLYCRKHARNFALKNDLPWKS